MIFMHKKVIDRNTIMTNEDLTELPKLSIMIVDDNPSNLRVLYNILKDSNYTVHPASSGEIALRFLSSDIPDLIMLDVRMPGMDGYEVCKIIKADERTMNIPIVFISGLDELKDKVKGFEVGGIDYITKPFHSEEVLAHIKSHLTIGLLQRQLIDANKMLEERVVERTRELSQTNVKLSEEIKERKQAVEELNKYKDQLEDIVKERTAELAIAKERAESADHMKSAFLAAMSHELRTPLNSIIGFVGIILQEIAGPITEEQRKQLEMVRGSAKYLLTLINDIIDISKIEAGELTVKFNDFDMVELINEVAAEIEHIVMKKKLDFVVDVSPEVDGIKSDRKRVKQVLINLLDNAIKFTEKGSITLTSVIENGYVVTSIIDSGVGIKEEDQEKIFEAFLQLDTRLARTAEGTGLGLSICKRLVKLMGGNIQVDSDLGKGSTFTFRIPLRKE